MRFLVMVKHEVEDASRTSYEAGNPPDPELVKKMMAFNEELMKAGALLSGEGLHPSSHGAKLRFGKGGKSTVIDGPFTEAKELVGGFWILRFRNKEEAIAFMQRCPVEDGILEIREIHDIGDYPKDVSEPALEFARKRNEYENG